MPTNPILAHFPFPKPRAEQLEVMDRVNRSDKRFIFVEAPTGVGKSPMAVAFGLYYGDDARLPYEIELPMDSPLGDLPAGLKSADGYNHGAWVLTTQKILQAQYLRDFGSVMVELKGAAEYKCDKHKNCKDGQIKHRIEKKALKQKAMMGDEDAQAELDLLEASPCACACPYKLAKDTFLSHRLSLTNFAYFLTESQYVGRIKPREILIVDEAHNIEQQLMENVTLRLTERKAREYGAVMPRVFPSIGELRKWLSEQLRPAIQATVGKLSAQVDKAATVYDSSDPRTGKLQSDLEAAQQDDTRAGMIIQGTAPGSTIRWVLYDINEGGKHIIELKPLDVGEIAQTHFFPFGKRVIMMSATILDAEVMAKTLGIAEDEYEYITVGSPFPVENRLIYQKPVGGMNMSARVETLPKLIDEIRRILDMHAQDKGIIHTHSYANATAIFNGLGAAKLRMLFPQGAGDREACLREHLESPAPTVLLSPSMTEGVDLSYDSSRFQILCKVPYPYRGDNLVVAKDKAYPGWYNWKTALTVVQACGRSVRAEDDFAATYILDADWTDKFYRYNNGLFPQWFKDALETWNVYDDRYAKWLKSRKQESDAALPH